MASKRVRHTERGFSMDKTFAEQVMRDHCSITWVVEGETIRDTSEEERLLLRAEQAQRQKLEGPLPYAEIPGLTFQPPLSGVESTRESQTLIRHAHEFASRAA
jgi:hypothetical protein